MVRQNAYRSRVFFSDDRPRFNEIVKIVLPESTTLDLHARILFYNRRPDKRQSDKGPFALSFLRILDNSVLISDTEDEMIVYKLEGTFDDRDVSYTKHPSTKRESKSNTATKAESTRNSATHERNGVKFQVSKAPNFLKSTFYLDHRCVVRTHHKASYPRSVLLASVQQHFERDAVRSLRSDARRIVEVPP